MQPNFAKGWKEHRQEFARKQSDPEANITPMTLEGCLVKLCDTVSYLGRDLEDAISLGMIRREKVPATLLGQSNEALLRAFAEDLINQSKGKEYLQITEEMFSAIRTLRAFNFAHIYRDPRLKVESSKVQQSYRLLFHFLLDNFQKQGEESYIWQDFLCTKQPEYLEKTAIEQKVVDYIAGMTDGFFLRTLQKIFIPSQIDWSCKP